MHDVQSRVFHEHSPMQRFSYDMVLYFCDVYSRVTFPEVQCEFASLALHNDAPCFVTHPYIYHLLDHVERLVTTIQEHYCLSFARVHSHFFGPSCYEFEPKNHRHPEELSSEYDENLGQLYH